TAFIIYHFGRRALHPLFSVFVAALVTIDLKAIGDSSNVFWLSHSVDHALIAVFTAFVFWRSAPWEWMNANLAKHGRWSVFLAFVVLWIVHAAWPFTYGRGFVSELLRWDLGTAAAAIIGATALRHAPLVSYFQRVSPRLGVFLYAFAFSFMVLCILVLPIR